jgi:signal transduction histidine kinase
MSLVTRFSAFFLTALALVLSGFSGALYALARTHLYRQIDDRLVQALDTLEASVDIEPGGLEWEPADRQLTLGVDPGVSAVRWVVREDHGSVVDRSANARTARFPVDWQPKAWRENPPDGTTFGKTLGWRVAGRRLRLDDFLRQGRGHPDDEPGYETQYKILVLVAGLEPSPVEATLNQLGITLAGLSVGIWVVAATGGRLIARRSLAPLTRMAETAGSMSATDFGSRLPAPGTGDELETLGCAFNGLLERLHEAFERQRRFAGDASHQLRTPLAALLGQVQFARRRDRSAAEYRQVLDRVNDEGMRLRKIVEALLFLAEPHGSALELQSVDLADLAADCVERWSADPRSADLNLEISGRRPFGARVHPTLLGQLLDNLVDNACKYSPAGSPIVLKVGRESGAVLLGVRDQGAGVSAEDAARMFDPFFRAEKARGTGLPGSGLGLSVARRIAAAFEAALTVQTKPGEGSQFTLSLREVPIEIATGVLKNASSPASP